MALAMDTSELLKTFFNEQFNNTSMIFLYNDKKLLKEGRYIEFASEQIKKARKIFLSASFSVFLCSWYGIISLIEYGVNPNWFDLSVGLISWIGLCFIVFYSSKEYYTIKSSMNLFLKMIEQKSAHNEDKQVTY